MKQIGRIALTMVLTCSVGFAAEQTWAARISSSMCQAQKTAIDQECIMNCIKAGAKYVFVAKGKSYDVQNQDFSDLEKHAGHTVRLTGTLASDGKTVTVSKIEMRSGR